MSKTLVFVSMLVLSFFDNEIKGQSIEQSTWETQIQEINCMEVPVLIESTVKVFEAKSLKHNVGYAVEKGWAVKNGVGLNNLQRGDGGYLVKSAYYQIAGTGLRVIFRLKIDNNDNGVWDKLIRFEIFDNTTNNLIGQQVIERNYFRKSDQFQNFVLHADLNGRENHTIEARIWYLGNAYVEVENLTFIIDHYKTGIPKIMNQSSSSDNHVKELINMAINGLGFNELNHDGPNANDIFYVNDYYMAWVDQTGYYGKMNGLWQLNNEKGVALDFIENMKYNGRIVNFLAVAEDGDGKWLGSYMGAEHFEIPSYIKENDDNATPVEKGISGWYSVNEANPNLGTGGTGSVPWWTCCSGDMNNKQSFGQMNPPVQFENTREQLQITYMAPLTNRKAHV